MPSDLASPRAQTRSRVAHFVDDMELASSRGGFGGPRSGRSARSWPLTGCRAPTDSTLRIGRRDAWPDRGLIRWPKQVAVHAEIADDRINPVGSREHVCAEIGVAQHMSTAATARRSR